MFDLKLVNDCFYINNIYAKIFYSWRIWYVNIMFQGGSQLFNVLGWYDGRRSLAVLLTFQVDLMAGGPSLRFKGSG